MDGEYYSAYAISKDIKASFCIRQLAFIRRKKPAWEDYSLGKTMSDHASRQPPKWNKNRKASETPAKLSNS
jgi:hypothetical protein